MSLENTYKRVTSADTDLIKEALRMPRFVTNLFGKNAPTSVPNSKGWSAKDFSQKADVSGSARQGVDEAAQNNSLTLYNSPAPKSTKNVTGSANVKVPRSLGQIAKDNPGKTGLGGAVGITGGVETLSSYSDTHSPDDAQINSLLQSGDYENALHAYKQQQLPGGFLIGGLYDAFGNGPSDKDMQNTADTLGNLNDIGFLSDNATTEDLEYMQDISNKAKQAGLDLQDPETINRIEETVRNDLGDDIAKQVANNDGIWGVIKLFLSKFGLFDDYQTQQVSNLDPGTKYKSLSNAVDKIS